MVKLSTVLIGGLLGVCDQTTYKWLKRCGIPRRDTALRDKRGLLLNLYWGQGLKAKEIGKLLGKSDRTIYRWLRKHGITMRARSSNPANLTPRPSLAYVFGVCLGDGSVYKSKKNSSFVIELGCKDRDFAEKFRQCLNEVVRNRVKLYFRVKKNLYRVRTGSKQLYKYLGSKPFDLAEQFPRELLKGFADSEGTVDLVKDKKGRNRKVRPKIGIINTNLKLLTKVKELLARIGIESKIYLQRNGRFEGGIEKVRSCWGLYIQRQESVKLFAREVGFSIARKMERLKGWES